MSRTLSLLLFALAPSVLRADVPMPVFPECGEPYVEETCPSDVDSWSLLSYVPESALASVRPAEIDLGSGLSADVAFSLSTGRWDVIVAITDSGISWDRTDLTKKFYINTGELPLPMHADGSTSSVYDLDGNGLVNVMDYAEDPRVLITAGVDEADWLLEPSDLIYTFSDGVDDDHNGYTDDISGWDFFAQDNDPWNTYNDGYGTHGTGVMKDAGAEGNDGGDIGTCPNCAILPVRIGDTFITDGTRAGQGITFAVDSGANVIGMAIGALSHPSSTTSALEYARQNDVLIVAATGDENAYHHNFPAMIGDNLYVHSVRGDNANEDGAVYSFMNFFNCNNYGPRVDLVAGTSDCATGSVALISGVAGLVKSAALDAGYDLDANELRQVLTHSVDDVWLSPDEVDEAGTYPSSEGWDPFYGYGRINAAKAVEMVQAGRIPPRARFASPQWFGIVDPLDVDTLELSFEVGAKRSTRYDWTLSWGQGWEPTQWTELQSGSGTDDAESLTYTFDLSKVAQSPLPEPDKGEGVLERVERAHEPAVTFRLTVTDAAGNLAEARRTTFVYEEPTALPGFPVNLGSSLESSPIVADLDDDGVFEVVIAASDGRVHALYGDGTSLPGWPVSTDTVDDIAMVGTSAGYASGAVPAQNEGIIATAAVADIDGDASPEIVVGGLEGRVYAWHTDGSRVSGFPVRIEGREPEEYDSKRHYDIAILGAPTLVDIDGDGLRDVVVAGGDSRVYVWNNAGALLDNYPVDICHPENCGTVGTRIVNSLAVGDIDGDGDPDFAFGGNETTRDGRYSVSFVIDARSGQPLPGWPQTGSGLVAAAALLPIVGEGHPASVALADFDKDGSLELMNPVMLGQVDLQRADGSAALELNYNQDGFGPKSNSDEPSFVALANQPAIGDITGDGVPDIFLGGAGTYALVGLALTQAIDFQHVLGGWDGATGEMLEGWPRQVEDFQFLMSPAIADVSGDGAPEVIYGSAGYFVHAWDANGNSPPGWPKFTGQWLLGSPAVGDIDGDGWLDVVVSTREGYLFAWTTEGRADGKVEWASIHHDPANTGNYHTVIQPQTGPPDEKRCGCASSPGGQGSVLGGAALLVFTLRRRKARSRA